MVHIASLALTWLIGITDFAGLIASPLIIMEGLGGEEHKCVGGVSVLHPSSLFLLWTIKVGRGVRAWLVRFACRIGRLGLTGLFAVSDPSGRIVLLVSLVAPGHLEA